MMLMAPTFESSVPRLWVEWRLLLGILTESSQLKWRLACYSGAGEQQSDKSWVGSNTTCHTKIWVASNTITTTKIWVRGNTTTNTKVWVASNTTTTNSWLAGALSRWKEARKQGVVKL